ncbi:uncharacterized protein CTHT_0030020 [Thermochaetoides thermophila DSM 1495]|uniref:Uncharacterized protein n=1 Tax=Chaetomium thermophilum (strain DSM 1495 / CBS 144.50 / IMI 039719) TaxID=759272 RepID=G0S8I6_CHATD|nr:hypothetical protein CTHT_0030020 [Thermochaetoides thermophila DSM 1495]EGS21160.1 hypothetical protein CTHT_0030020 [Thermochaetoides thermophila DSM 1495]
MITKILFSLLELLFPSYSAKIVESLLAISIFPILIFGGAALFPLALFYVFIWLTGNIFYPILSSLLDPFLRFIPFRLIYFLTIGWFFSLRDLIFGDPSRRHVPHDRAIPPEPWAFNNEGFLAPDAPRDRWGQQSWPEDRTPPDYWLAQPLSRLLYRWTPERPRRPSIETGRISARHAARHHSRRGIVRRSSSSVRSTGIPGPARHRPAASVESVSPSLMSLPRDAPFNEEEERQKLVQRQEEDKKRLIEKLQRRQRRLERECKKLEEQTKREREKLERLQQKQRDIFEMEVRDRKTHHGLMAMENAGNYHEIEYLRQGVLGNPHYRRLEMPSMESGEGMVEKIKEEEKNGKQKVIQKQQSQVNDKGKQLAQPEVESKVDVEGKQKEENVTKEAGDQANGQPAQNERRIFVSGESQAVNPRDNQTADQKNRDPKGKQKAPRLSSPSPTCPQPPQTQAPNPCEPSPPSSDDSQLSASSRFLNWFKRRIPSQPSGPEQVADRWKTLYPRRDSYGQPRGNPYGDLGDDEVIGVLVDSTASTPPNEELDRPFGRNPVGPVPLEWNPIDGPGRGNNHEQEGEEEQVRRPSVFETRARARRESRSRSRTREGKEGRESEQRGVSLEGGEVNGTQPEENDQARGSNGTEAGNAKPQADETQLHAAPLRRSRSMSKGETNSGLVDRVAGWWKGEQ